MLHGTPLEGDGISIPFFHLLWTKSQTKTTKNNKRPTQYANNIIRIPDTVIFKFGLPQQWYFTSKQNHKIQRKRKHNTTTEKVKEYFIDKNKNIKDGNDIIGYFIHLPHFQGDDLENNATTAQNSSNNESSSDGIESNNIEYFDKEGLNNFLYMACHKQSTGILQRFIHDPITTPFNSLIRTIYTPNLCVVERRITKQSMYDNARFGLYERVITFEGPEVYSRSVPLRGNVLSGCMKELCDEIVEHIFDVTRGEDNKEGVNVTQMVLHLKVDTKERIWVLWSSSIRVGASEGSTIVGDRMNLMSIDNIVQVPSVVQLQLQANHDSEYTVENVCPKSQCLSCGKYEKQTLFHPITYKYIITHFEEVLKLLIHTCYNSNQNGEEEMSIMWPPDPLMIKAGGGVGFAPLWFTSNESSKDESNIEPEDLVIPPMIRELYKRLKVEGYKCYRHDPLFLDKTCLVCEACYLVYANLASTSFQMIAPIYLDNVDDEEENNNNMTTARGRKMDESRRTMTMTASTSGSLDDSFLWLTLNDCKLVKEITQYEPKISIEKSTMKKIKHKTESNDNEKSDEAILFDDSAAPSLPNPILGVHKNDLKTTNATNNNNYTKKYVNKDIEKMFKHAKNNNTTECRTSSIAKKKQPLSFMKNSKYGKLQQQQQEGKEQNDNDCFIKKEKRNPYEIPQILKEC